MREARIVVPLFSNKGLSLAPLILEFERSLLEHFGGFTSYAGRGSTMAQEGAALSEQIRIYDIAALDVDAEHAKLRAIALWFGRRAEQLEMYLRYPNGDVELVIPSSPETPLESGL